MRFGLKLIPKSRTRVLPETRQKSIARRRNNVEFVPRNTFKAKRCVVKCPVVVWRGEPLEIQNRSVTYKREWVLLLQNSFLMTIKKQKRNVS